MNEKRFRMGVCVLAVLLCTACAAPTIAQDQNGATPAPASPRPKPATEPSLDQIPEQEQPGPKPTLMTPLKPQRESAPYLPVTSRQRLRWFLTSSIGPQHLVGGVITSAFGTALDRPAEYGPGWAGFGERYGMRLTGVVTGNAMEAGIGALWGEDPRYFRVPARPFGSRVKNVVRQAFVARRRDGDFAPAYARYIATAGNNFLSNEWRVSSESNIHDALLRTGEGFAGRMASNAFEEFWPDVERDILHRNR